MAEGATGKGAMATVDGTISWAGAQQTILGCLQPLPAEAAPLDQALGRVTAEQLLAGEDVPPFTNSAMDGFAVQTADLQRIAPGQQVRLQVLADLPAGRTASVQVGPGQAVRIMTGAPLPDGADCVVPVEDTASCGEQVAVLRTQQQGANVRQAGEDIRSGTVLLEAGTVLRPAELGLLASVGCGRVAVHRVPRVAVVTTGDELCGPDEPLAPGRIRDSNSTTMSAQVRQCGAAPLLFPRVPDTRLAVRTALEEALGQADVVLTSGGVSMGEYDFVKEVLAELGARPLFWRVAQKPGHPLAFWLLDGRPVFGIPGNPVSTMICLEVYVRPALRRMMGHRQLFRPERDGVLVEGYRKRADGRLHFLRVRVEELHGLLLARSTGPQGSGILTSMARANGLALIPEEIREIEPGHAVRLQLTELPEDH